MSVNNFSDNKSNSLNHQVNASVERTPQKEAIEKTSTPQEPASENLASHNNLIARQLLQPTPALSQRDAAGTGTGQGVSPILGHAPGHDHQAGGSAGTQDDSGDAASQQTANPTFTVEHGLPENGRIRGTSDADVITVNRYREGRGSSVSPDRYSVHVKDQEGNSMVYVLSADELAEAKIEGGRGDDKITVAADVDVGVTMFGGKGNDRLEGGQGDDTIHGDSGHDFIYGGEGVDSIFGGTGVDVIYAGADASVNTGKGGRVFGAEFARLDFTEDLVVAHEDTTIISRSGDSIVRVSEEKIVEAKDWLRKYAIVPGESAYRERTAMDIAVLLSTDQGQGLLGEIAQALDDSGETLTFADRESFTTSESWGGHYVSDTRLVSVGNWTRQFTTDTDAMVAPLPVLFHELVHAWQFLTDNFPSEGVTEFRNGNQVRNIELQATGLPWIDENGQLRETPDPDYPYSENEFRAEIGLNLRDRYGDRPHGTPVKYIPDSELGDNAPPDSDESTPPSRSGR